MKLSTRIQQFACLDHLEVLHARFRQHRFPIHCHSTFVIQLIHRGEDRCSVNGLTARAGEVFVHFPNEAHSGGTTTQQELDYSAIYPTLSSVSSISGLSSALLQGKSFLVNDCSTVKTLQSTFDAFDRQASVTTIERLLCEVYKRLFGDSRSIETDKPEARSTTEKIELAVSHLCQYCQRNVSNSELAEVCKLSEFHLIRTFKQRMGITPRQFLISQRVALAKRLIATGLPLVETALHCGFADQSHLNRCFKKVTGYLPGEFSQEIALKN